VQLNASKKALLPTAVKKLNDAEFDKVTLEDIKELFAYLDVDNNDELQFSEMSRLMKRDLDPPCEQRDVEVLYELTDKRPDGTVRVDELYRAIKSNHFKDHLLQLQKEARARKQLDKNVGNFHFAITRDLLLERLKWRVNRDDSFKTLPFSLMVLMIFIGLVITHLQVWRRQQVQRGVEAWIEGYGYDYPGPYQDEHVQDQVQMWDWMGTSGLKSILRECTNTSMPRCSVASRSVLVGDLRLVQKRQDGSERSEWLLHSPEAQQHLAASPGQYFEAALARLQLLRQSGWVDADTDEMALVMITYAERAQMFVVTRISVIFDDWGFAVSKTNSRACIVDPYPVPIVIVMDILYVLLLLYPSYIELREIINSMRVRGISAGFYHYWNFWNVVDWMGIVMGWTNTLIWLTFCAATQADAIQDLLDTGDGKLSLVKNAMSLDTSSLEVLEASLLGIVGQFYALQLVMGINVMSIMLKFFKAFQANPRLQLVTNTLIHAADELFHFGLVFLAIFMGFTVSGHIFFGDDLVQFSSFDRSVNTAFAVLLGDFDWYSAQSVSDKELGSGMPQIILALWFWVYTILVLLILLNMLLAIVMEHYTELVTQVRERSATDAPAIWTQASRFVQRAKETKGFIPLYNIVTSLSDKKRPAHPGEDVTLETLMEAFGTMKQEQANFILEEAQKEAKFRARSEGDQEHIARLKEISALVEAQSNLMHNVSLKTLLNLRKVQDLETHFSSRLQSMEGAMLNCVSKLDELELLMHKKGDVSASAWSRSTPRGIFFPGSALESALGFPPPVPTTSAPGDGPNAAKEVHGPRPVESEKAVAEPKLQPSQAKRKDKDPAAGLQPCCGPVQGSAGKSRIASSGSRR